jgi:hypothetical protein
MLTICLLLIALGVSYVLTQSQANHRDTDQRELVPVRVRAARGPVVRRRVR